jgi:hypothetical protein
VEDRSKDIYIYIYAQNQAWSYTNSVVEHVCDSGTILCILVMRERKREWKSNSDVNDRVTTHEGRGHKNVYWKMLKNGGWELKG